MRIKVLAASDIAFETMTTVHNRQITENDQDFMGMICSVECVGPGRFVKYALKLRQYVFLSDPRPEI